MMLNGITSISEIAMVTANISQTEMSISTQDYYQNENNRFISFMLWPINHVPSEKLARYGFYYENQSDHVHCYSCRITIGEWGVGDDPLIEHHKHSPDCNFINLRDPFNIPANNEHELIVELKALNDSINNKLCNSFKHPVPRHPDFKEESARLKSYNDWPKSIKPTPEELSSAGFFYLGISDEVKCFCCGGCLKDWELTDSAYEEHNKFFFKDCPFIVQNYQELKRKFSKYQTKALVKTTPLQLATLTTYMNENSDLKDGKINFGSCKDLYNKLWSEITETLNNLNGPKKSAETWKEVWRNHKYNKKRKSTPSSLLQVQRCNQDYEVPNKKLHIYNTAEGSNISTNQMVLCSNNIASVDQCYSIPPSSNNRNFELELQEEKCKNDRLQLELDRMKFEMEKREMQQKLENDKLELEKQRREMENERNLLPSYLCPYSSNY